MEWRLIHTQMCSTVGLTAKNIDWKGTSTHMSSEFQDVSYIFTVYALEIHYDIKGSQQKLQFVGQFQFQVFLPFCGQGKWWHYPMVWLISYNFTSVIVISWVLELYIYRLVYIYSDCIILCLVWPGDFKDFWKGKIPNDEHVRSDSVLVADGSTADDGP